jgi:hypothetical protein
MKREGGSLSAQARRLESELADLARRLHRRMFGAEATFPGRLSIDIEIPAEPQTDSAAGPELLSRLSAALQKTGARADAILPGRVFCYRCESGACEHAAPPRPQAVFAGFSPTGQPEWKDLGQVLLEARHENVDALFGDPPAALAHVQPGRDLKARLLHPFGKSSKTYDVLAQLIAGPFGGDTRLPPSALTVQAIESRHPDGRTRLTLHRVGGAAVDFLDAHPEHPFSIAFPAARTRLAAIESDLASGDPAPARRSELMRKIPGILHDLRRVVERGGRQRERRTRHADERRREHRPTQAALQDAWKASDTDLLADDARGTLIVLGPRGRAHAFTPGGKHVTSLILDREALSRRIARKRWRPATPAEIQVLRTALPARH